MRKERKRLRDFFFSFLSFFLLWNLFFGCSGDAGEDLWIRISWGFTGFYWVFMGFTGFYWVLLGFIGIYWVLLGFTGFYKDLLGFTWFHWV